MVTNVNEIYFGDLFCNIYKYRIVVLYIWNEYNAVCQFYLNKKRRMQTDGGEQKQGKAVSINQLWAKRCPKGFSYVVGSPATSKIYIIILFFPDEKSEFQRD